MSFLKENKLILSLLLAVVALGIVSIGMVSAQMTITKAKSADTKYWDIPKAESPNIASAKPGTQSKKGAQLGFIDPIVRQKERKERGGVPSPSDIFNVPGMGTGLSGNAIPEEIRNKIPANTVPKTPFDEMYDPDTQWDYWGRPGRLGEKRKVKMQKYFEALENNELGITDSSTDPENDPSQVPFGSKKAEEINVSSIQKAITKLVLTVITARQEKGQEPFVPAEGVLEEEQSEDFQE